MKVDRVKNLTQGQFMNEYLLPRKPVIVTDAMKDWDVSRFQPPSLKKEFGDVLVQVYDDLFALQGVDPLETYLNKNFDKKEGEERSKEYTRWYTKLKDVDFFWSDEVFEKLENAWDHPYFLRQTGMAIPFRRKEESIAINKSRFPYKGLFLSGKGARTRLHIDPFNSNAILCQFYGKKHMLLYSPDQAEYVMSGGDFVDPKNPDLEKFPNFGKAKADYDDILEPGEIVLFPSKWFHDVTSASDSISVTWNFVYSEELEGLYKHLNENPEDDQLEIARYFLRKHLPKDVSAEQIKSFLKKEYPIEALNLV